MPILTSERDTGHRDSLIGLPKEMGAEEAGDTGSAAPARSAHSRH